MQARVWRILAGGQSVVNERKQGRSCEPPVSRNTLRNFLPREVPKRGENQVKIHLPDGGKSINDENNLIKKGNIYLVEVVHRNGICK